MNEQVAQILIDLLKIARGSNDPEHLEALASIELRLIELGIDLQDFYNTQSGAW
jgi:hypothetical protein